MIEIADGLYIQPCHVTCVKRTDEGKCAVFVSGQKAEDGGFCVEREAEDVVAEIDEALEPDE
jgi:hypothetical protein